MHHDRGEIVARGGEPVFAECLGVLEHAHAGGEEVFEGGGELRVADAEDDVGPAEDLLFVVGRNAHHLADDLQRHRCRHLVHEVALAIEEVVQQAIDHAGGLHLHVLLHTSDLLGGEALGDDAAQAEVPWVVHADHRAEELGDLDGHVADVDATTAGEQLRVAADVPHVLVVDDRPVAGAARELGVGEVELFPPADRLLLAQRAERTLAVLARGDPELGIGEVEGTEGNIGRGHVRSVVMALPVRRVGADQASLTVNESSALCSAAAT